MTKDRAIQLLGGTVAAAAAAVRVSASAVSQWPEHLPERIEDRVLAALARRLHPELASGVPIAPGRDSDDQAERREAA